MSYVCATLHEICNAREPRSFPFSEEDLPSDGIYLLFERGETAHGARRIVRIGTHRGQGQLVPRLRQHFVHENKDRSIFRKNIGRCLLKRESGPFLDDWNLDLTSREKRERHGDRIDFERQASVEKRVSEEIHQNFSFVVLGVRDREDRLEIERKLIGTVGRCTECGPSAGWLGLASPRTKIRESGLWQTQHLKGPALDEAGLEILRGHWREGDARGR